MTRIEQCRACGRLHEIDTIRINAHAGELEIKSCPGVTGDLLNGTVVVSAEYQQNKEASNDTKL